MRAVLPDTITRAAIASFEQTPDPRLRELVTALTRHLHAFVAEVRPTDEEWFMGVQYLTDVGHACVGPRQEYILLSDVLGVSMLVDALNYTASGGATESTVLGPFFVNDAPPAEQGADIAAGAVGIPLWVDLQITDLSGMPIKEATVDVWQCDEEGLYDVQRGLPEGAHALRGRFTSDDKGYVRFWTISPVAYQIPADGPVGDLLAATGRHPWRPAHIHFKVAAQGFQVLVTHLFVSEDEYLGSDAVFGVKWSLICDFPEHPAGTAPGGRQLDVPWKSLRYNFSLQPYDK